MKQELPMNRALLRWLGAALGAMLLVVNLFTLTGWIAGGVMFALAAWRAQRVRVTLHDTYIEVVGLMGSPRTASYANIARIEQPRANGLLLHLRDGSKRIGLAPLADAAAARVRIEAAIAETTPRAAA